MHKKFDHKAIEKKWQKIWKENGTYDVGERDQKKEKEYLLVEWPYPSGNLHIGHWFAFAVPDIYVRAHRMQGKQVLFPMGFDAFGLPAENAAIKRGINPREWTEDNIEYMKGQLESMGNAFSWDKTTSSTDPDYYKWTQWMFTKFFEKDIAYRGSGTVNWCPGCQTVIANEQIINGDECERSGDKIEHKEMPQWMLRITNYADRLVDGLDTLDWPEHIKESQRNWIGRSEGAEITFETTFEDKAISVFTTRPDTLYGATYMVLAPEHALVDELREKITNWSDIEAYRATAAAKSEQDRLDATKEKTGVKLEGINAINPGNGEEIPVYIADYVLAGYGTGAIMAVPAHDDRDGDFAKKYDIPTKEVIEPLYVRATEPGKYKEGLEDIERKAITATVYDPQTKKYLGLQWKQVDWETFVTGGIEEGQTPEEAARAEIYEETGYKNLKLIKKFGRHHSRFFHVPKGVNRFAHFHPFLFELENDEQDSISEEETKRHDVVWLTSEEMRAFKLPDGDRKVWNEISGAFPVYTENGILCNSGEFDGMGSEEAKVKITEKVGGKMTNTYRLRDWSIGRQRYWGVPIPIVYDPEGTPHAIPEERLPWLLPEDVDPTPTGEPPLAKSKELKERTEKIFGKGWTPEVETMDTFVDSSWYFLRYLDNKNDTELSSEKSQKDWMQIDIYFGGAEHTTMHLLYSRFWQKALYDLKLATHDEPYKRRINRGLVLGPDGNKMSKSKGNVIDPDEQVGRLGADTVKMYLAFLGPYGEITNYPWDMGGIAGIRRFLERVSGLSEHISDTEPESTTKLLHKTIEKVTKDIDAYKFNTAISALMMFVNHAEKESLTKESYETFLKLIAAFAPHLAEELWHEAGNSTSVHEEQWPVADESLLLEDTVTLAVQFNGKARGTVEVAPDATEETVTDAVRADERLTDRLKDTEIKRVVYVPGRIINFIG